MYSIIFLTACSVTLFLENPSSDQLEGGEDSPLLLQRLGVRGHGAWSDATDVSMVPPAGHKKHRSTHTTPEHLRETETE